MDALAEAACLWSFLGANNGAEYTRRMEMERVLACEERRNVTRQENARTTARRRFLFRACVVKPRRELWKAYRVYRVYDIIVYPPKLLEIGRYYRLNWDKYRLARRMEARERADINKLGREILRTFRVRHPHTSRAMELEYMERAANPPRRRITGKQPPAVLAR